MTGDFIGHSVSDASGNILTMDEATTEFLHRPLRTVIGINYAELTHPDDLVANVLRVRGIELGEKPVRVRKRYVRPEAPPVLADVYVSRMYASGGDERLVGSLFVVDPIKLASEAEMLRIAAADGLASLIRRRDEFGSDLFADHAWHILLETYLAEAEGRIISLCDLADCVKELPPLIIRWIKTLEASGLVECGFGSNPAVQLTTKGFTKIEGQLAPRGAHSRRFILES